MDPNACLERAITALHDMTVEANAPQRVRQINRTEAAESLEDLRSWINGGGFPPDVPLVLARLQSAQFFPRERKREAKKSEA